MQYKFSLDPLYLNPNVLQDDAVIGAIANQDNAHWVALKRVDDAIWLLNSLDPAPRVLSEEEYIAFINTYKHTFPIRRL